MPSTLFGGATVTTCSDYVVSVVTQSMSVPAATRIAGLRVLPIDFFDLSNGTLKTWFVFARRLMPLGKRGQPKPC